MNKTLLKLSAVALIAGSYASLAFAADEVTQGKVNFTGKLVDMTCSIEADSQDQTVTLPTMSTTSLAKDGDVAGSRMFDIKVEKCPSSVKKVAAHFETTNLDPATRNAKNLDEDQPTGAKQVTVELLDSDGTTPLKLGTTGSYVNVKESSPAGNGTATLSYGGRYHATGATTAGTVKAIVSFTLAYE
jgi:major type 1 subunit fimbrin (pilin)